MSILSLSNFKSGVITVIGSCILSHSFGLNRTTAPEQILVVIRPTFVHQVNVHQPLGSVLPIVCERKQPLQLYSDHEDSGPNQDHKADAHNHSLRRRSTNEYHQGLVDLTDPKAARH